MLSLVPFRSGGRALEADIAALDHSPVAEAREALAYWRGRAARLPWYRWEARREARIMASRWRERLLRARLERRGVGALAPVLAPLARGRRAHARAVARWLLRPQGLARRVLLVVVAAVLGAVAAFALGRRAHARAVARWLLRPQGLARRVLLVVVAAVLGAVAAFALVAVLAVHLAAHVV